MYQVSLKISLLGAECSCFQTIREMSTLEGYAHEFVTTPDPTADIIIADLDGLDANAALRELSAEQYAGAHLVVLANREHIDELDSVDRIDDVWLLPMDDKEVRFRFARLQRNIRMLSRGREYEREAENKKNTLETIFTTLECGVLCHSLDGKRILSVNRAALEILGYETQEELAAGFKMVAESVLDEDKPKLRACIQSLKEEGDSSNIEYRALHNNGEIRNVIGNVKLIRENDEFYYQRFLLDVTEQRRQEREIERRNSDLIYALSIEYGLVCFFDLDTGKGLTLRVDAYKNTVTNNAFVREITLEESMSRYTDALVYEEDRELFRHAVSRENLLKVMSDGQTHSLNYRSIPDGTVPTYFELKVAPAGHWDDDHHGVVLGLRSVDVERHKQIEQRALLESALDQANRANRAKSVFLSNMSHDLRTPMNAIVGFTALSIAHINDRERVEDYLKKIMSSGNHMLSLVNDVLDMSRIESGKMHIEENPCSLADILRGVSSMVRASAEEKNLTFTTEMVCLSNKDVFCDKLRLDQVLLNILSNSIKYTNRGGSVLLRIIEREGAPEGYANFDFVVTDTGIGMSPEFIAHIFEPFEREKNTTTSGVQGTGLGMAITKNIVDMMNGRISVKSEQDVGTEMTVSLTFRLADAENHHEDIGELRGCRALAIDPDEECCGIAVKLLSELGMRADGVTSGSEALELINKAISENDRYKVFVVDWTLQDINAVEISRKIHEQGNGSEAVLVLTAYDWSDIEGKAKQAGITSFCRKPLFLGELHSALNNYLDERSGAQPQQPSYSGNILLVEDNELNQEIASELLQDAGFEVDIAANGKIAVEMMEQSQPGHYHVVLMDIQMPVMNGYEATRAIRALTNRDLAAVPIVAMTANAFEEDRQEAMKSGMDAFISKPIDVKNLFDVLGKIISQEA